MYDSELLNVMFNVMRNIRISKRDRIKIFMNAMSHDFQALQKVMQLFGTSMIEAQRNAKAWETATRCHAVAHHAYLPQRKKKGEYHGNS